MKILDVYVIWSASLLEHLMTQGIRMANFHWNAAAHCAMVRREKLPPNRKPIRQSKLGHKRQKPQAPTPQAPTPQAPTPQAPIRNRQTRKVANVKGLKRNTNLT